jgi:hypothetical protein
MGRTLILDRLKQERGQQQEISSTKLSRPCSLPCGVAYAGSASLIDTEFIETINVKKKAVQCREGAAWQRGGRRN